MGKGWWSRRWKLGERQWRRRGGNIMIFVVGGNSVGAGFVDVVRVSWGDWLGE